MEVYTIHMDKQITLPRLHNLNSRESLRYYIGLIYGEAVYLGSK